MRKTLVLILMGSLCFSMLALSRDTSSSKSSQINVSEITSSTALYLEPSTIEANPLEYFTVALNIDNVTDLISWQAQLGWNQQILDFVNLTKGDFLNYTSCDIWGFINQTEGRALIFVDALYYDAQDGVNGSGTLANIVFRGIEKAECTLSLNNTKLFNSNPELVPTPPNLGDAINIENNSIVNMHDIYEVVKSFGKSAGTPGYNPNADFDADGFVDLFDLLCCLWNFNRRYPPYPEPSQAYRPVEIPHVLDLDTDGDGLRDSWERNGIDANGDGIIDLDLSALGADWRYKDIFVEVDYMGLDAIAPPNHDHRPYAEAINDVKTAFRNAPVSNPNGTNGIALHVQVDEEIPHHDIMNVWSDFDSNKTAFFGTLAERNDPNSENILSAKKLVYRYCLFIHDFDPIHYSGIAEPRGNDFIVSLGAFTNNNGTRDEQAGTFMHELGHNLGLRHGGGDDTNGKPNYLSIMSYSRQFSRPSGYILSRPLDYSRAKLPTLDESNLDETVGIGGPAGDQTVYGPLFWNATANRWEGFAASSQGPINWNRNGVATDTGIATSINDFTKDGFGDTDKGNLESYDDWANLVYNFRLAPDFADGVHSSSFGNEEITWEIVEQMRNTTIIGFHDITLDDITPLKTVVGTGYSTSINATVANQVYYLETFNVTLYANETSIAVQNVTLTDGASITLCFTWNTSGFAKGNYTVCAYAEPVPNETNLVDNNLTCPVLVHVGVPGDVSSSTPGVYDKKCDMKDIAYMVALFNTRPSSSNWNPNADVDNNGVVSMIDIAIAILNFNKHE